MTLSNEWRRMQHYKNIGLKFNKVLDIGAFEGIWAQDFKNIYPDADVLMIEANEEKEEILKNIGPYKIALLGKENNKEVDYYKCLDGMQTGNTIYKENTDFKFAPVKKTTITLPTLLNSEDGYDLIKMDVQGSELDIIKGAVPIIKKTTHLILETQTLNYNDKAPRLTEIVCYLNTLNFSLIDIIDLHYALNNTLFQVDVLFERRIND